eukprot:TRINITY_DN2390_c0_g1_i15.p1 TRINITY_DN2390_c0_g1~~TRINITY_DN2390_c0_g1_i15.p1  ORF type:complete len:210 (-),score=79.15 TRINITY_DN2390_c0_g1_i15:206-835(-)
MSKDSAASSAVLKYFQNQNRPYSAQDVFMNLHKEHGKPLVQRVIDQLVAETKLKEKLNGKQKCYVINQDNLPTANDEELAKLDSTCAELANTLHSKQDKLKSLDAKVRKLNSSLTSKEAEKKLATLQEEVNEMEERLEKLQNNTVLITTEEKNRINKEYEAAIKLWKKRKRTCTSAQDSILESCSKKKKDLLEEIGIDTDESVGAVIPS